MPISPNRLTSFDWSLNMSLASNQRAEINKPNLRLKLTTIGGGKEEEKVVEMGEVRLRKGYCCGVCGR